MWQGGENPTRMVEASRPRLVEAFDGWQKMTGRSERGTNTEASTVFLKSVIAQLDLSRDQPPNRLGLPTSRSTWSTWRSGRSKPTTKIRLDVCRAVMALTGVDVTSNGFLEAVPVNATDLVTIGPVTSRPTISKDNTHRSKVFVEWIDFRASAAKEVTLDLTKEKPAPTDERFRVGTVRYALREASLFIESDENVHPIATHVGDGKESENGIAEGLELAIDRDDFSRWRIQPPFPKEALQARLESLTLCECGIGPAVVGISVTKGDVEPSISLDQGATFSNDQFRKTRERLVQQILRNRLRDPGERQRFILSRAKAIPK